MDELADGGEMEGPGGGGRGGAGLEGAFGAGCDIFNIFPINFSSW